MKNVENRALVIYNKYVLNICKNNKTYLWIISIISFIFSIMIIGQVIYSYIAQFLNY